ncbi:MAG: MFS transporter [Pseudonocardia sp.]|nr:MFS transporter [Pseudonocardia sp.]
MRNNDSVARSRSEQASRSASGQPARAGWSSGGRRRKIWVTAAGESPAAPPPPQQHQPNKPRQPRSPPSKLTVTRVAAWRGRQLTEQGVRAFHGAAGADGADRSGLRALIYTSMMDYGADAALAVALANTLFFSAAAAESRAKVALYLLVTVAPFALVAPVIGPLLDRLQRGRRLALALSFVGRAVLAIVMALHFHDWALYPAALGVLVLSKSFTVLRAAVTPRVLPTAITLVTTNSRLTVFGLLASGVSGAFSVGFAKLFGSAGALCHSALLCCLGSWLCTRIPRWVEITVGEVPASLRGGHRRNGERDRRPDLRGVQPMGRHVVISLWANGTVRVLSGFLTLFTAFVVKAQTEHDPVRQLMLLGVVGAAAGAGSISGNAIGARQRFDRPDRLVLGCAGTCVVSAATAALFPGIVTVGICALVTSIVGALAKVCLDAVIQRDLPERSRASAFGRSESVLQLAWVAGGAFGVLLPPVYWIGFTSIAVVVAIGAVQAGLIAGGRSLVPWIRHRERAPASASSYQ